MQLSVVDHRHEVLCCTQCIRNLSSSVDIKVRLVKYSVAGGAAAIPSFGKGGRQRDPPWIGTNYTGESGERVSWEC